MKVYIYGLFNPIDFSCYYIGKTNSPEYRKRQHFNDKTDSEKNIITKKIIESNRTPIFEVLCETTDEYNPMMGRKEWQFYERHFIKLVREKLKEPLTNVSVGGGGGIEQTVYQYDSSGKLINKFNSVAEASEFTKVSVSSISHCCRGIDKSAGRYIWRYDEDNIGSHTLANNYKKTIYQYDLSGRLINKFNSVAEASRFTKISVSNISACCSGKTKSTRKSAGKYMWGYNEDNNIELYIYTGGGHKKQVYQYNLSGNLINKFNSVAEASRLTKINRTCISACCRGRYKSAGGYIWKYQENK